MTGLGRILVALALWPLPGATATAVQALPSSEGGGARLVIRYDRGARPEPPTAWTPLRFALVGRWEGEDYTLTIDQDAVQANRDPEKPFQWDALHILDATGDMIVFELGGDRFIALLTDDHMTLTQAGIPGHRHLVRKR